MTLHGKLCSPIREMLDGDEYGTVIFHTRDYKQSSNTRISILNLRKRCGYKYKTKLLDENRIAVIRPGGEGMAVLDIDIREEWE